MQPGHLSAIEARALVGASEQYAVEPFIYTTGITPLASGATVQPAFQIQANSSFIWIYTTGWLTDDPISVYAADGDFQALASIRIENGGSGRNAMDAPVFWHNLVGTAQRPLYLPTPAVHSHNSAIQLTIVELLANDSFFELCLHGVKVYAPGS